MQSCETLAYRVGRSVQHCLKSTPKVLVLIKAINSPAPFLHST